METGNDDGGTRRQGFLIYGLAAAGALAVMAVGMVMERASNVPDEPRPAAVTVPTPVESGQFIRHAKPVTLPALSFNGADGKARFLSEWRGKIVLLNIWATWCPPCVREMPALDKLQAEKGGDGFAVVAVSTDRSGLAKPKAFYERVGIKSLALFNETSGDLSLALDADRLPLTIILDREGREVGRYFGAAEWDSAEVFAKVMAMAGATAGAARR
ncbi:Redoxin domain protein [Rhodomicrobium vannielii ATCC 17100]|uniref:Redoxin domain protein n=1 Tax=Rhodomicrobium vannielii (strain ATCC 17100 / DSM 162 / LMG 4299 / NCIMB 10020 / ATH 3.1.1) TaxID=648757 RepID=E3I5B4_RHOVT|nr:TlpA disulfide reductase family protein [Rhodomicrobium vannielii]ADP71635.1 Redoxin domain protein [Rhodomicrobium vannielii ATCC 17100]